jgi:AraC family transcriptional regulator of adaptative response/methylated-DNA-[protein]-cysteine methyltransferase
MVQEACEFIRRHAGEPVSLRELAARAALSPFHFQRTFRAVAGVTPKEYAEACRLDVLKARLKRGSAVTAAIYDAGYGSSSRLYERADSRLGMTPRQFGRGGTGVSMSYACAQTPFGLMMIAATDRGLCSVQFGEDEDNLLSSLRAQYPNAAIERMRTPFPTQFAAWMKALVRHLEAHGAQPAVPLDVRASAFQMRVWKFLQGIPPGEVRTYTEVAAGIGRPSAARAVARACATNPVAIVVPCHRVIRGSGALAGYRWGLERKKLLIEAERARSRAADATKPAQVG